jgi:tetratricopeptide (TPR) repeat protein
MDLATLARIHRELDELAAHPRSARALATAWWQLVVLAPAYPAVYLQQGAWLLAAGDADGAAKLFAVAAEATGDPTFDLRRVDCLRALGGEDSARAALEALVASPRGADDVRGRWRLAVLELDRDRAPRRAAARLTEFLNGSPVRDAEDLRRKLPALLLLLECGRAGGWAERMEGQFAGVDAEVLAACAMDEPAERGGRLREALRGDPYHAWGRYALAAVAMAAGEPELARANLEVAVQGEPVLAWRARHDPAFAGLSLADLDPAAELPCEPWIRVEGDHLPAADRSGGGRAAGVVAAAAGGPGGGAVTDAGLRVHARG